MDTEGWWPCVCTVYGPPDPACRNCNGLGRVEPRDWCAACKHRRGADCAQERLGVTRRMRVAGGLWVSNWRGVNRLLRCPRYDGPETAPIAGREDTGG